MGDMRSKIVERHYADAADKDWQRMKTLFTDDVVTEMPGAGTINGVDAFIEYSKGFFVALPDARMEISSVIEQGNTVIAEGRFVGTHTGPLMTPTGQEIPPTGKKVSLPFADVFVVQGDKVTNHRIYFDQMVLMQQLGLMPEPAGATA